jgi:FtsP/CotA-like multicopper oxidase with cupredoxin domain
MNQPLSRRTFLQRAAGISAGIGLNVLPLHADSVKTFELSPKPGRAQLVPEQYGDTAVWCFNDQVPGPELRVKQGDRVRIRVHNGLDEQTTVHWHGMRVPNSMDGVPYLTQTPINAGQQFEYEFDALDAGTFWYHPHQQSSVQVGRGLYGALIVEEATPNPFDRDLTWVLDDWRLARSAQIVDDFGHGHDLSHSGRIGNTVTVNGKLQEIFDVHAGERIRLRLINAANARIFALRFGGHDPKIIAMDGHPVTPHSPQDSRIVIGPGMRVDLVLDMSADPDQRHTITDEYYPNQAYALTDLVYSNSPVRDRPADLKIELPPNPLAEPELNAGIHHEIAFEGGAMGLMDGAVMDGAWRDIRSMAHDGKFWAINGVSATGHIMDPMLTLERNRTYILTLKNRTAWPHPMHLHGHSFRVLSRNGEPTAYRQWQDTVLLEREDQVEVAFVADNPGDWMFHCHILEHQASGMMGVIRVT